MSRLSKLTQRARAVEDWIEASDGRTAASLLLLSLIPASFFVVKDQVDEFRLKRAFAQIDRQEISAVFDSVAACEQSGIPEPVCRESRNAAYDRHELTRPRFTTSEQCHAKFESCNWKETTGKIPLSETVTFTSYFPSMSGWQFDSANLSSAVPLYARSKDGALVRKDGKVFIIPPANPAPEKI